MRKIVYALNAYGRGSVYLGVLVQPAQAGGAVTGYLDLSLKTGRTVTSTIYMDAVLVENHKPDDSTATWWNVRGHGWYETADDSGRLIALEGLWTGAGNDPNRYVDVHFVSGPLRGKTYIVTLPIIVDGHASGIWVDEVDPQATGSASGVTDLPH